MGIPLPAATQWEVVAEAAKVLKPVDELIRQAAQGEVLHNGDTSMRVARLVREPSDQRMGVLTSGIVATSTGRKIALCFTAIGTKTSEQPDSAVRSAYAEAKLAEDLALTPAA
jgi:transposase